MHDARCLSCRGGAPAGPSQPLRPPSGGSEKGSSRACGGPPPSQPGATEDLGGQSLRPPGVQGFLICADFTDLAIQTRPRALLSQTGVCMVTARSVPHPLPSTQSHTDTQKHTDLHHHTQAHDYTQNHIRYTAT